MKLIAFLQTHKKSFENKRKENPSTPLIHVMPFFSLSLSLLSSFRSLSLSFIFFPRSIRKCQILNTTFTTSLECRSHLHSKGSRTWRLLQVSVLGGFTVMVYCEIKLASRNNLEQFVTSDTFANCFLPFQRNLFSFSFEGWFYDNFWKLNYV